MSNTFSFVCLTIEKYRGKKKIEAKKSGRMGVENKAKVMGKVENVAYLGWRRKMVFLFKREVFHPCENHFPPLSKTNKGK